MGVTHKQRTKISAALSMIYAQGYDAQTVVNWAKAYQKTGHNERRSYELALNDFIAGQPEMGSGLGKVTRLIEASDPQTVAKYETALNAYIETGDDTAITALGPMIARDSVELAARNGELSDRTMTAASIEAAVGFAMADVIVNQAIAPATPAAEPQAKPATVPAPAARSTFAFAKGQPPKSEADPTAYQVSPYPGAGYAPGKPRNGGPTFTGTASGRGLLAGARRGDNALADRPSADAPMSRAEAKARIVRSGVVVPVEAPTEAAAT